MMVSIVPCVRLSESNTLLAMFVLLHFAIMTCNLRFYSLFTCLDGVFRAYRQDFIGKYLADGYVTPSASGLDCASMEVS